MAVHHYMVDYLDEAGDVQFANPVELTSLTKAKALASKVSQTCNTGAYVVAYADDHAEPPTFTAVGHISFFDGKQSETDGIVL